MEGSQERFLSLVAYSYFNTYCAMPFLTFDRVLKVISTILNILAAALAAFTNSQPPVDSDGEGHA